MCRVDIHQHLWPEPLLRALSRRREPPSSCAAARAGRCAWPARPRRRSTSPTTTPTARAALAAPTASTARWSPRPPRSGIEALPAGEAEPLLAAYHEGVAALPAPFGAWAAVGLAAPDPAALARLLDAGFAGACVAAEALGGPAGYERLGPVLETLERRDAPLLVHPGPAPARPRPGAAAGGPR